MKKLLVLLTALTIGGMAIGAQVTQTAAQIQQGFDNALGIASIGSTNFTFALTATPQTVVPTGGFMDSFAGSSDFTVNTNGTITCNFTGVVCVSVQTSFAGGGGSATFEGDIYLDAVNTHYGFIRNVSGSDNGSAAACQPALSVTSGEVITFKCDAGGNNTATFYALCICVHRID